MNLTQTHKTLINRFNTRDSVVLISSFPKKGEIHSTGMGGLASFAKNTVLPMAKHGKKVVVLADMVRGFEMYVDEGILVIRCWKRNQVRIYADILSHLRLFSRIPRVLVEFEFASYGDFMVAGFFPLFLLSLKLMGKQVITVVHQVLTDLESLAGHVGMHTGSKKIRIMTQLVRWYYLMLALFSHTVVVLEEEFRRRLLTLGVRAAKVRTIVHGVEERTVKISKRQARKQLGFETQEKVVMIFGFLGWYKGVDLAVRAVKGMENQKVRLVLAGGESVTQVKKAHYQRFMRRLYKLVAESPHVEITGFVPEHEMEAYFAAADVVVLPYRVFMSSSGAFALALAYGKPVLLSEPLRAWFDNGERKYQDLVAFFEPTAQGLQRALEQHLFEPRRLREMARVSKTLGEHRHFSRLAMSYGDLMERKSTSPVAAFAV